MPPRTVEAREIDEALEQLGHAVLKSRLTERVHYRRAVGEGRTVFEMDGTSSEAARIRAAQEEVAGVAREVLALLEPTTPDR